MAVFYSVLLLLFCQSFFFLTFLFFLTSEDEIGPPDIKVDISDVLLHIKIIPPGGPKSEIMSDFYDLSYQILYWKNSSDDEV